MKTKRILLTVFAAMSCAISAIAGGGKLTILMEEGPGTDQYYLISEDFNLSWTFHNTHWKAGRSIISARHTPLGWCYLAGKEDPRKGEHQQAMYHKTKDLFKELEKWNKEGTYVTSVCFGQMDGMGRSYWQAIGSQNNGYTAQEYKELGFGKIKKWAEPYMAQGYRITDIAPSTTKWLTVLTKGTDIDRQEWAQYDNYDEFVAALKLHWDDGWLLQIAEVSPSGKYVAVYCTYTDGRSPRQFVTVASTKEEAKAFIGNHYGKGVCIKRLGGSYLPGLLCNYDSNAEKMNAIMGIVGGIVNSGAQLAADIQSHSNQGISSTAGGDGEENIPSGLSQGEYQGIYDRFARNAESAVNSLTAGSVSGSQYTIMKKQLREAQRSMRKTREEARRAGHTITQSKWETATVNL